ncbi:MAG: hypothetical protein ACRDTH_05940, partial [Pseudonocardiaceae bacterium]
AQDSPAEPGLLVGQALPALVQLARTAPVRAVSAGPGPAQKPAEVLVPRPAAGRTAVAAVAAALVDHPRRKRS